MSNTWRRYRARKACFHHDRRTGTTWITSQLIDTGMRKLLWCTRCGKDWII